MVQMMKHVGFKVKPNGGSSFCFMPSSDDERHKDWKPITFHRVRHSQICESED